MATQKYRSRLDHTVGENRGSPTKVAGRPAVTYRDGSENKTPAPVKTADEMRSTSWGRGNLGSNGYDGPSSLHPGETASAGMKVNAPVDAVLDNVIRGSESGGDDWQTRKLDDPGDKNSTASPVHSAMAKRAVDSGSPGGTIPAKNGNPSADYDARRAQQLKQAT